MANHVEKKNIYSLIRTYIWFWYLDCFFLEREKVGVIWFTNSKSKFKATSLILEYN